MMSGLISDETLPCSVNADSPSINTNDHLSVIFDSGWLIAFSPPLTTINDSKDIIVGFWLALLSILMYPQSYYGITNVSIQRLDAPPYVLATLWCLAPRPT